MSGNESDCLSPRKKKRKQKKEEDRVKKEKERERKREESEQAEEKIHMLETRTSIKCFEDDLLELGEEINAQNYQVISLLGVGSQGRVYLVRLTSTDQYFALKVFKKEKVLPNEKTIRSILTEHRFLSTTDHPFITKLFHSFHSHERLFMIMEFCPGGELFTTIKKQPGRHLNEEQVRFYASEVILVLEYVHSRGYIYRDLKPENILLHLDGHIRMADFGLSKQCGSGPSNTITQKASKSWNPLKRGKHTMELQSGEVIRTDSLVGSVHYLAPEVVGGGGYDAMADWWALGVLLYDMFYGFPPFAGKTNKEIIRKISLCDYSFPDDTKIGSNLKSLIKGLLKLDPRKRIRGAAAIKRHAFFTDVKWGLLRNQKPPILPNINSPCDTTHFETYAGDEDSVDFNFFSELPDDPDMFTEEEQQKFEEFTFTRDCYAVVLQERQAKLDSHVSSAHSGKYSLATQLSSTPLQKDEVKAVEIVTKVKKKEEPKVVPVEPSPSINKVEEKVESGELDRTMKNGAQNVSKTKRAKSKPARKQSATHKEDDLIQ